MLSKPEENAQGADSLPDASLSDASLGKDAPATEPAQVAAPQVEVEAATEPVPQVQANDANPDATSVAPPGTPDAVPVDANYSAFLGAVVHALAELYGIKDDAKVVITSDMVSAANFTATLEVNDGKLTITLTPVDDSAGPAALKAIKLRLAEKPAAVVSPAPAVVSPAEVQAPAPAVVSPGAAGPAEAATTEVKAGETIDPEPMDVAAAADKAAADKAAAEVQATTSPLNSEAAAGKEKPEISKVEPTGSGGYRRRKRNLRTIKKQQQRNRRTMNKH